MQVFFVLAFHIHSFLIVWLELCSRSNSFHLAAFSMGSKTRGKRKKSSDKNEKKRRRKATASRKRRASPSSISSSCSSTSSSSSSCSSAENKDDKVFRRGLCLYALPARRLHQLIKSADKIFDETWTLNLTPVEAFSLLWALTHINPGSAIGAKTYREAKKNCNHAAKQVKKLMGPQKYDNMVTEVIRAGPKRFLAIIETYGFDPQRLFKLPPDQAHLAPAQGNAQAPPDLAPRAPSQGSAQAPSD